jgi:hypothetical protein
MGSIRDKSKILGSEDQSQDHLVRPKRKACLRDLRRARRPQFKYYDWRDKFLKNVEKVFENGQPTLREWKRALGGWIRFYN